MKRFLFPILLLTFLFSACEKENLPPADAVQVKFINKTGADIEGLVVTPAKPGLLEKGKTTGDYFRFEKLGQQFGYALVDAVGTIDGKRFYTAAACQGECGTASAPAGEWLENGYYKISIHIAKNEPNSLEFRMQE
ncbi:MAG: hypothetical protein AAB316_08255 [Bacteroidota bacterium]